MADIRTAKYPTIDCEKLKLQDNSSLEEQIQNAIDEWETNQHYQQEGFDVRYQGFVQCFCDDEFAKNERPEKEYGPKNEQICLEYND